MADARHKFDSGRDFGLLELLTALSFLVIVMGLMVSLARFVRAASAEQITRKMLRQMNEAILHGDFPEDADAPALPGDDSTEPDWAVYAKQSNPFAARLAGESGMLNDAWGNPIAYLASQHPDVGMATHDQPFCFSAGPDGLYRTKADNLYTYEQIAIPKAKSQTPGGQSE